MNKWFKKADDESIEQVKQQCIVSINAMMGTLDAIKRVVTLYENKDDIFRVALQLDNVRGALDKINH